MASYSLVGGAVCHFLAAKLLLFQLLWEKNCRAVSLITQELVLVVYLCRYLDLLYLYVSFSDTLIKVHLVTAWFVQPLEHYVCTW